MFSAFLPSFYAPTGSSDSRNLIAACTVLPVLGIVVISMRFVLRKQQKTTLRADDWCMALALIGVIAMAICGILGRQRLKMTYEL